MKRTIILLSAVFMLQIVYAQQLKFSESKDIKNLLIDKSTGFTGDYTNKQSVKFFINQDQLKLSKTGQYDLLTLEGAEVTGKAGDPTVYVTSQKVILENDAIICGVKLINGEYVKIENSIFLAPRSKPVAWYKGSKMEKRKSNEKIYKTDAIFPGYTYSYNYGSNGKNTELYLQFFPVQYNPVKKKAYLLINAEFEVYYKIKKKTKTGNLQNKYKSGATNIILTTQNFLAAADSLKNLHQTKEGITSDIVTVEWINSNYPEAANPTAVGYANVSSAGIIGSNYNYSLAKKIISFLNDTTYSNLESITILGDAAIVPPSYYFYIYSYDDYNNWICSDIFYGSPDYDYIMNYQTGRLPASTVSEAALMVSKLKNWKTAQTANWFNNIAIVGGDPFGDIALHGEVIALDAVNKGYLKGNVITKDFLTNNTEDPAHVLPHFSSGNTGFIYHIGHGGGNIMYLGEDSINYSDLMALSPATKFPVVVSIACMNGGYDAELMTAVSMFSNCFAEGVLRSQAGGIAYFGGVRVNYGVPDVTYKDNGEMIVGPEPYMAKMLTGVFKAYSAGNNTFGSITNDVISSYYSTMDVNDSTDWFTFFEFVLLGDPALSFPLQGNNLYSQPVFNVSPAPMEPGFGTNLPVYYHADTCSIPMTFTATTTSPSVNQKLFTIQINGWSAQVSMIQSNALAVSPFTSYYTPIDSLTFIQAYETSDYKETRLYFAVQSGTNFPPSSCVLHEVQGQNNGSYDVTWSPSIDFCGTISSYLLNEYVNPYEITETCDSLDYWENNGFSVQSGGYNGNCFYSGTGDSYTSNIVTILADSIKTGDSLIFWTKYEAEEYWDFIYVEIAEVGEPFEEIDIFSGTQNSWLKMTYDLSGYVGKKCNVRFSYITDYSIFYNGFYIDDINLVRGFNSVNTYSNITDTVYHINNNPDGLYDYRVKAIDNDGIIGKGSNPITVKVGPAGISDNIKEPVISIYPNPAGNILYVDNAANTTITLFNILGDKVIDMRCNTNKQQVNISNLKAGIYVIRVIKGNAVLVRQIVKN